MMKNMTNICSNQELNELVEAYRGGDQEAFTAIYPACQKIAKSVYYKVLKEEDQRNRYDFDELFQDAVVRMWEKLDSFDAAKGDFRPWFGTLFKNCILSECRTAKTHAYTEIGFIKVIALATL